jgi:hypothetical protein
MATTPRFAGEAGKDNTERLVKNDYQTPAYAATLTIVPKVNIGKTLVIPATLTGAVTLNIGVGSATTDPFVGDTMTFILTSDTTSRTVTFGTGITATSVSIAPAISKSATITFMFNGTAWMEVSRAVQA